jgi:cardiolipin synthase A/B
MRPHTRCPLACPPGRAGWFLALGLLAALAGCRTAAVPYAAEGGGPIWPRGLVLARQIMADTAVEVISHPCHCAWVGFGEMKEHLAAFGQGLAGKRLALNYLRPPDQPPCPAAPPDPEGLEACLRRLTGRDLQPASVQLYSDGWEALAALNEVIDRATCRIDVLMFYWENDTLGEQVAARLAARAGAGVHVRVLVDGGGNLAFCKPAYAPDGRLNRTVAALAHHPAVEVVRIRNPFACFDHRKLVLVDGQVAWTGGRNFASSAFFKHHDLSFTLTGPLVGDLQQCFDDFWKEQGGREQERGSRIEDRGSRIEEPGLVNGYARLLFAEPGRRELARGLYQAIDRACHHVYVENVYFSDSPLVYKLARARRRGVDVRAVVTFSSSSSAINRANRMVANRLLRAGVRVYVYPVMTHVKAAAVDGCWAYLGTGNFDPLSLRHNRELGLAVSAGPLLAEVEERLFREDFRPEGE